MACPVETRVSDIYFPCRILADRTKLGPGGKAKVVKLELAVHVKWGQFLRDTKHELAAFLIHDFVARWQAELYHDMFKWLPEGGEMWISDYIENFKMFSKVEIQQEFYNRDSLSIFICLVIRRRRVDEAVAGGSSDYHLPDRLTCDVHVFVGFSLLHTF